MKQKIIITALPNGIVARGGANTWKVSAAIGLQVEDANTTLQNVPDMLNWATLVKDAKFLVQLNGTVVEAKVITKPVDTQLWKNLFSSAVKVKSFIQEDLAKIPIASYPIKHVLGFIKFVVEATGKNFSNDLPSATDYTENPLMNQLSDYQIAEFPQRGREKNTLDKLINKKRTGRIIKGRLNEQKFIPFSPTAKPEEDFVQLKNFHGLYDNKQVETFIQVPPPEFEFHNILAALSSYPQLLRRLGLVVDLEFTAPTAIMRVTGPTNIRVVPSNINFTTATQFVCPATAYNSTAAGFYARPLDGSSIDKGHLKINADGFTVFQVDTDGAALKMCQQMDGLLLKKAKHIFYASEGLMPNASFIPAYNNEAPRKEGLPTNRTAGIAVAKDGRAAAINASFKRMNDWKAKLMTGAGAPAGVTGNNASWILTTELLYADDVNLGYRMDIQPEGSKWFSLHKRNNKFSYLNTSGTAIDIPGIETDEGFIQTAASEEKTDTGTQLKIGEAIARWEGWSLSVPRPGSSLNDPMLDSEEVYDKSKPGMAAKEEAKYKTPGIADFKLNVKPSIEKGSLPMLRFGKKYSVKIRTVDLAGNSVDVDFKPENADTAIVPNIKYMRYEPVDAPFLVLGNIVKDGESSEVMVIRSNEGSTVEQYESNNIDSKYNKAYNPYSIRHVKPPRTTVEMATLHSMLDKGFGTANATEAAAIYNKIKNDKDPFVSESDTTYKLKVIDKVDANKSIQIEYLSDPMAAGVTFFLSSNDPNPKTPTPETATHRISFYTNEEIMNEAQADGIVIDYDKWMTKQFTFRVILKEDAPSIKWDGTQRALVVSLPKGVILKMNYACFWRPSDVVKYSGTLQLMSMNSLGDAVGQRVARGQHWMFSPFREITFVHAVQQPITAVGSQPYPIIKNITVLRDFGANFALLNTRLMVHGPSTDKLDIEGEWTEWIDDVSYVNINAGAKDDVQRNPTKAKVFHFTTLYNVYEYVFGELVKNNPFTAVHHKFNDTKHRRVTYKSIASTRYREYFYQLIADKGDAFSLTRESVKTNVMMIPSSARPVAPQVEYIIPTFEWDRIDKGASIVSGRASGLRIYLRRPWYSSGEGEQLGVVIKLNITDNLSSRNVPVTTWGTDPTKLSATLPNEITPDYKSFVGIDEKNVEMAAVTVEDEKARVTVIPYDVKYDKDRQLYYVDVMLNPVAAYYPFVRFALVRYQKNSVRKDNLDCCISAIVQADYIQIPAPRLASLQFGNPKTQITVSMSGTIPNVANAAMFRTKLQFIIEPIQFNTSEDTHISLDIRSIDQYEYIIQPADVKNFGFVHSHTFRIPDEYATKPYRIKVLEYEMITYDPLKPNPNPGNVSFGGPAMKDRLVFAEVYEVNKV